ncbi:MAG: purine-nucleoside phosphorylase [Desulfobulbaceae bacterium]|jgi:purine-nucleoside phosphorylase|nr:purine-nucleoside phosphorylase [Desulfobulbaceae bacterium]
MMANPDDEIFADYRARVVAAVEFLRQRLPFTPEIVIQLGTGLGAFAEQSGAEAVCSLPYNAIPGLPPTTVTGHQGQLILTKIHGKSVAILRGRFHYYEGYAARLVALPLRLLSLLGAKTFIVTNAAGGLNLAFQPGAIMLVRDHLYFLPDNPLRGPHIKEWGARFPDLSAVYTPELRAIAQRAAVAAGIAPLPEGVYACVAGPSLETPAETRWLRQSGADAVGMSSVPEILVACQAGMRVLALSVISNINDPDNFQPILIEDIIAASERAADKLRLLLLGIVNSLAETP